MQKVFLALASLLFVMPLTAATLTDPPAKEEINWVSMEEAVALNRDNPRKILIDVYTDWCGWCKRMDATTYEHPEVVKYINENYYAVKLDGEGKEEIQFKGNTFKFVPNGRRGYHEFAAALMQGKMSYPTTIFMDEELNLLSPVPGYQKAESFYMILSYFGKNLHKSRDFQEYRKSYQSPF